MEHSVEVVRGGVRLPRSSARNCRDGFLKLLLRVDPDAEHGFGFEGKILRPGTVVTDAQLHPTGEYPETPIVLECAPEPARIRGGHHANREQVYVLWRLDVARNEWAEIGRSRALSWEWAVDLRPLAMRALAQRAVVMPDLLAVERRIAEALRRELDGLEPPQLCRVLAIMHDQLAQRVAAIA